MNPDFVPARRSASSSGTSSSESAPIRFFILTVFGSWSLRSTSPTSHVLLALRRAIEIELRRVIQRQPVVLGVPERLRLLLHLHDAGRMEMRRLQIEHRLRSHTRYGNARRLGLLGVRRVLARVAAENGVLAAAGQHVELVREAAADGAAVGLDRAELDAEAREDALVGLEHPPILAVGIRIVDVEGVAVLHDELAAAHQPEARADLVAELRLDLEQVDRQLLVALDDLADDVGDDLFVRGAEAEIGALAILEAQQLACRRTASGRFPATARRAARSASTAPAQPSRASSSRTMFSNLRMLRSASGR